MGVVWGVGFEVTWLATLVTLLCWPQRLIVGRVQPWVYIAIQSVDWSIHTGLTFNTQNSWVYTISGLDYWTGLLDSPFNLLTLNTHVVGFFQQKFLVLMSTPTIQGGGGGGIVEGQPH